MGTSPKDEIQSDSPFDRFNRNQGLGSVRNPYSDFEKMRAKAEVQPLNLQAMLTSDMEEQLQSLEENTPQVFTALSYEAVSRVLRDGKTFSSAIYSETMGPVMGHTILEMDEPEHGRYRSILQKAFTQKALARWEDRLVRPVVNEYIDAFIASGRADLVRELTFPFPVTVIAGMLGLPREDLAQFHRWSVELISVGFNPQAGLAASKNLSEYFQKFLDQRRHQPKDDLISVLAHAKVDEKGLSDEEVLAFLRLLLPAGAETTYRSSSNLIFGLLTHPDQFETLRKNPHLMAQAIEEGLRWEPPLMGIVRRCTRDTKLLGAKIPQGAMVFVNLGAANHDASRFEAAECFDILRKPQQNMAFGFGAHRCLGMFLARMETRVCLEAIMHRLPNLRLDPEVQDVHVSGLMFRTPLSLPVCFGSASGL